MRHVPFYVVHIEHKIFVIVIKSFSRAPLGFKTRHFGITPRLPTAKVDMFFILIAKEFNLYVVCNAWKQSVKKCDHNRKNLRPHRDKLKTLIVRVCRRFASQGKIIMFQCLDRYWGRMRVIGLQFIAMLAMWVLLGPRGVAYSWAERGRSVITAHILSLFLSSADNPRQQLLPCALPLLHLPLFFALDDYYVTTNFR